MWQHLSTEAANMLKAKTHPATQSAATIIAALLAASASAHAHAYDTDAALTAALEARIAGDRVGACVAVAVVGETTRRAMACADPARAQRLTADTAFEIGSITKTMTAYLVADLIEQGKMALDDPIAKHLPEGTRVPDWQGKPVRVRHLVTHSSGLPALPGNMASAPPNNPYSRLDAKQLLEGLGAAKLKSEPGQLFEYSNFGMMVMSLAVSRAASQDFEPLLKARLFTPLGMKTAHIADQPKDVTLAKGHTTNRQVADAWTITPNLAGVGMVRASLNDMITYARAAYGDGPAAVTARIKATQAPLHQGTPSLGMNWWVRKHGEHTFYEHGGGTGGFSSLVMVDAAGKRAVVVLQDAAGGAPSDFALHLLDAKEAPGKPRRTVEAPAALLKALAGDYMIGDTLPFTLREQGGKLLGQARGQREITFGHDSTGTFFALDLDASIRVVKTGDDYALTLLQGGGVVPIRRAGAGAANNAVNNASTKPTPQLSESALKAYEGVYPLSADFKIKVFVEAGKLMAQATGQGAFPLTAREADVFVEEAYGIRMAFIRTAGAVTGLHFKQGPNDLKVVKE
jgi:serine-type D-Ala-D-Ala carboxypeptidase/endopeptidase